MTNPYLYDSDVDYYNSLLTPYELRAKEICEDDPFDHLTESQVDDMLEKHWEEITQFLMDEGYVYDYVLDICKKEYEMSQEP